MAKVERQYEDLRAPLSGEYLKGRAEQGWRAVAIVWERDVAGEEAPKPTLAGEVPYGLRVADDCLRLVESPVEREAMAMMLEMLVQDASFAATAEELNRKGFRTREGWEWSPVSVFNMLPRLIEVGPQIFSSEDWPERRQRLTRLVGRAG